MVESGRVYESALVVYISGEELFVVAPLRF